MDFADTLEKVTIETVMKSCMTKDLATLVNNNLNQAYNENDEKVKHLST